MNTSVIIEFRSYVDSLASCNGAVILNAWTETFELGLDPTKTIPSDGRATVVRDDIITDAGSRAQRHLAEVDRWRIGTLRVKPILQSIPIAPVAALTSTVDGRESITKALLR